MIFPWENKGIFDKKKTLGNVVFPRIYGGRNRIRTCDPVDVNDVFSARGSFVREKHELHTSHESP
jgi:hypothetical protein